MKVYYIYSNIIFEMAERRVIQSKKQREKIEENEQNLLWLLLACELTCNRNLRRGDKKEKKIFEEILKNFSSLVKI